MLITVYTFFISSMAIAAIAYLFGFQLLHSLLIGFILGGVSSIFVILVIKNLGIKKETYSILTGKFEAFDRKIINSIFTRGIAAAVLAQLAIQYNLQNGELIAKIVYSTIMFTVVLSSARIFLVRRNANLEAAAK